jgi:glycosyltransferase involved in cell wall biosynthesis
MRIAVFHNLPPGGAKRTLYEQVKYLSRKHEIDAYEISRKNSQFCDLKDYVNEKYLYEFDINKSARGLRRLHSDYRNFFSLKIHQKKIAKIIDSRKYDIVLVHSDIYTETPYILRFLETSSVYHCHEWLRIVYEKELSFNSDVVFVKKWYEYLTRKFRKYVDKKNAEGADKIIASSSFVQTQVKMAYEKKARVCYPGVDSKIFKSKARKKRQVLIVGGKNKIKGYYFAEEIVSKVRRDIRPELVVLGFRKGERFIERDNQMAKIYSESLTTLCLSSNEPFGLMAIESMACETPVLAVDEGGFRETVVDGVTGFLLPRDPKVFVKKIEYLIANPKVAKKKGKAGRKHVMKNFSWERHGKQVESVLEKVVKRGKK